MTCIRKKLEEMSDTELIEFVTEEAMEERISDEQAGAIVADAASRIAGMEEEEE